ncbi:MAG TPA: SPOR domain-containing protein [Sulfuricella sp.]|nr:SPOR domain-containing protein [Sulfuricella sp.]
MANQQALSDDEIQLRRRARRRLIGAITLVTVMVVTLPMVLDGESRQPGQDIVISIPPQGSSGEFSSRIVPIPAQPTPKQGQGPAPAAVPAENAAPVVDVPAAPVVAQPQPSAKKAEMQPARPEGKKPEASVPVQAVKTGEPGDKKPAAAAAEAQPKPKEASSPSNHKDEKSAAKQDGGPFVVQLGAFASPVNAKDRQARLSALKIKFYTETVKTPGGDRLRVRAGPYATRHDAERIQAKLKAAGIKDGVVAEKKN